MGRLPGCGYRELREIVAVCVFIVYFHMDSKVDDEVIRWIREGDREKALQFLYKKYRQPVVGWIKKHFYVPLDVAVGVFQDSLVSFFLQISRDDFTWKPGSIRNYLIGTSKNILHKRFRANERFTRSFDFDSIPDRSVQSFEEQDSHVYLRELVENLGDSCRELIKMFYFHDAGTHTIAQTMGISEAAVRKRRQRCLKKLRESLKLWESEKKSE